MSAGGGSDAVDILLVEDNPGDVMLMEEALRESGLSSRLHVVGDGNAALEFLRASAGGGGPPRPRLILLDLNLPGTGGHEVLRAVKGDENLRRIPVIVLTTSGAPHDIRAAYDGHANCYIRKPLDFESYASTVRAIRDFWFSVVELPSA